MKKNVITYGLAASLLVGIAWAIAAGSDPLQFARNAEDTSEVKYNLLQPSGTQNAMTAWNGTTKMIELWPLASSFTMSGGILYATPSMSDVTGLTAAMATKFNNPTGNATQCIRGDGSITACPGGAGTVTSVGITSSNLTVNGSPITGSGSIAISMPSRSFSTPTRSLNTCFQISATRDALVSYAVDVTTTVTLGGTPEGAVFLRTYTNSGCSAGQVGVISGSSGQPTTLTVSVGQQIKGSANLYGMVPAGTWARIETSNVGGGTAPTFTLRTEQQEVQF